MPDTVSSSQSSVPVARPRRTGRFPGDSQSAERRNTPAKGIPRRPRVSWWLGLVLAIGFAALVTPAITAEHWLLRFHPATATEAGTVTENHAAPFTVRAPMFAGYDHLRVGGGVVIARGEAATHAQAAIADAIAAAMPRGPAPYLALFGLTFVLAALFTHHMRRSIKGRLVRVQIVSLAIIAVLAVAVKAALLSTALSALVVPVAALALVPTMALDRVVGLATGVLAALVVSLMAPFDVGLAILLLVQAATAGLVGSERPRRRRLAVLVAGLVSTLSTGATYLLLSYLTTGGTPELGDPLHATWLAAAVGPAIAAVLAVPVFPIYQLLVGEITQGKLFVLEDLGHPLLRQIAERSPGTWQHSLMMANMAEIAANAIGANGRLVRVGAYFHDLGKSLQPKYFIENLEAGETSPHDLLPPEVSCDAIFAHVTEGIARARKARLHERIVDFMHMHHGDGVLEYFWAKCREQGNPNGFDIDDFRYPGHPPQSRETAILAICDAVEAASRTLKKPDAAAIDALVQRIVYGKLHLGQLDESGLSMSDLRQISDSLRETIRHANHGRIEYPWQKAEQDASASVIAHAATSPRLDSLDRRPGRAPTVPPSDARSGPPVISDAALATTADVNPASEQRIPIADSPSPRSASSDVVRVRASTAPPSAPSDLAAAGVGPRETSQVRRLPTSSDPAPPRARAAAERQAPASASGDREAQDSGSTARGFERGAMPFVVELPPARSTFDDDSPSDVQSPVAAVAPASKPPPALIVPDIDERSAPAPRTRAATLPPPPPQPQPRRPPTVPPPPAPRSTGLADEDGQPRAMVTLRGHVPVEPITIRRGPVATDPDGDAGSTEPSLPVLAVGDERRVDVQTGDLPVPSRPAEVERKTTWSRGLAARIDAALESDEWSPETPVVAPTRAELRALLGQPDPTRPQPVDELAVLQRRAAGLGDPPRRAPHPTFEVDPDDIEAQIEIAPPARRPAHANVVGVARPKKPE